MDKEKYIPEVKSMLRSRSVNVPEVIYKASGIKFLGVRIKIGRASCRERV